jgi:hypothetical protein
MAAETKGTGEPSASAHLHPHHTRWPRPYADRRARLVGMCLGVALAGLLPAHAVSQQSGSEAGSASVESLAWLAGCWAGTLSNGAMYEETWLPPRGGTLLGVARMSRNDRTLSFEFMRIVVDGGTLVYAAQPSGREPTLFRATTGGATDIGFENPEHDFPQRIFYRYSPPDGLHARIEGLREGQLRGIDFPLRRVACPDLAPS